jgi:NAD(P)-dependent dehydrogenase (short-subunit alcohol dehydrogenase family)
MPIPQTMIVTGASRGIGAQIARQAAQAGFAVAVNYHRSAAEAQRVVDEITAAGGRAVAVQADVSDEAQVRALFAAVDRQLGPVGVLVNNAGTLVSTPIEQASEAGLLGLFRANVFSAFYCASEAVKRMSTAHGGPGGVIVNLSSAAARHGGLPNGTQYSATKGAIDAFTTALAKEVGACGIRVNALRPGVIDTAIHEAHGGAEAVKRMGASVPLGRAGTVGEVADAVMWLASNTSTYVHGAVIDVSGGR